MIKKIGYEEEKNMEKEEEDRKLALKKEEIRTDFEIMREKEEIKTD